MVIDKSNKETHSESAISVVARFNEAFNRHDIDGFMALMTDDCVFEKVDADG